MHLINIINFIFLFLSPKRHVENELFLKTNVVILLANHGEREGEGVREGERSQPNIKWMNK
jgi:hypothetical protein